MKDIESKMRVDYDHLGRVIAAKHKMKLNGLPDRVKIGIASTPTYPRFISFDLNEALKNCTLLRKK